MKHLGQKVREEKEKPLNIKKKSIEDFPLGDTSRNTGKRGRSYFPSYLGWIFRFSEKGGRWVEKVK